MPGWPDMLCTTQSPQHERMQQQRQADAERNAANKLQFSSLQLTRRPLGAVTLNATLKVLRVASEFELTTTFFPPGRRITDSPTAKAEVCCMPTAELLLL